MKAKRNKQPQLMLTRIMLPILALVALLSLLFYAITVYGGVVDTLDKNAEEILGERVANRANELETAFVTDWSDLETAAQTLDTFYNTLAAESDGEIYASADLQRTLLARTAPTLIKTLRSNKVNGIFLVLNNAAEYTAPSAGESRSQYGLCIRDYDVKSAYTDTEDLQVLRCPAALVQTIGCSLDTGWEALYTFDDTASGDYYYKPLKAAYDNPGAEGDDLAYFCAPHRFAQTDRLVISYSIPLRDAAGYPYGVLGVEISLDYLETLMPSAELKGGEGGYALVQYTENSDEYTVLAASGAELKQKLNTLQTYTMQAGANGVLQYCCDGGREYSGILQNIDIYNHNTPFEEQRLALVGYVPAGSMYSLSSRVRNGLMVAAFTVLMVGLLGALLISHSITDPIKSLVAKVRSMDGDTVPELDRLDIEEIDELISAIEELGSKVSANQVRTEFFSRMSHDMRTPMNAIIGFSSPEMLENADEKRKDEYLEKIHASGGYLLELINEVLDMTKIESSRMEIKSQPLCDGELLKGIVPIIDEIAQEKGVKFVVGAADTHTWYYADKQRLSQIIMNLLSNAVRFTPGGGTVTLALALTRGDDGTVIHDITVSDTGIGMSSEFLSKMYQPFSQVDGTVGGTGLGLSIARQLVLLMNGTIDCSSAPGAGTVFSIHLASQPANAPRALAQPKAVEGLAALEGRRVLLCEDNALNTQLAKRLLENRGMLVETAADGEKGVELFRQAAAGYYDAVLMDIRMPNMDGLEATRAIRALHRGDAAAIPIIAMTANAFAEDVRRSAEAGMNAHLAKPIDPAAMYATLAEQIARYRQ